MRYLISFTIPAFDDGEMESFEIDMPELTAERVASALRQCDAARAGVLYEESAPFDVPFFEDDGLNATFVIRTTGLGPTKEHNVLGHGHVVEVL